MSESIEERLGRLDIPFDSLGIDPYGMSKRHLAIALRGLRLLYKHYFTVENHGLERVPDRGRAMLIGNHSGGVAVDALMVLGALFFDKEPPRLLQSMAEKFISRLPVASVWASRCGQFPGLPEHAARLLLDDRALLVFPEGARGTAKLFEERYSLVDFGTGFMRLALKTRTPIVPFGCVGGGDAMPTIFNLTRIGKLFGAPYIPVTRYLLPVPRPAKFDICWGEPMRFEGNGTEDDEVVTGYVDQVKARIARLIEEGRRFHGELRAKGAA